MPNWVSNSVSVRGSTEDLAKFRELAKGKGSPTGIENGKLIYDKGTGALSFWNFIEPEDKEHYFTGDNWYNWNVENWGTKWDASDSAVSSVDTPEGLFYTFETPWGIPEPVFRAMVSQFPQLHFEFWSEEEQGWGASFASSIDEEGNSHLTLTKEWDVPDSHADYVDRENEEGCICSWEEDQNEWYSDCPRPEEDFEVVLNQVIKVRAKNAEHAWEISNKLVEDFVKSIQDENIEATSDSRTWVEKDNQRIYPTLSQ